MATAETTAGDRAAFGGRDWWLGTAGVVAVVAAVMALISGYNYLLFHVLVEMVAIVVGFSMAMMAWNARHRVDYGYILLLGAGYGAISFIDLVHTLSYSGMGVFEDTTANVPTQLWMAARYMEALTLFVAVSEPRRPYTMSTLVALYAAVTALLLLGIFGWPVFPDCYVPGEGLTNFKVGSEYLIAAILAAALWFLHHNRAVFGPALARALEVAVVLTIAAEVAFTFYVDVYGLSNLVGHLCKFASVFIVGRAVVQKAVNEPQEVLYRGLEDSLHETEARYQAVVQGAAVGIAIADPQGRLVEVNDAFAALTGRPKDQVTSRSFLEVTHPEDAAENKRLHNELVAGHRDRYEMEKRFVRPDGTPVWVHVLAAALRDENGRTQRIVGSLYNITARKKAEAELRRSNEALQNFAYVASHDLKEPLRLIHANLQILQKRHGAELSEHANTLVRHAGDAAGRMQQLVNDLLQYSRVGTHGAPPDAVDADGVVDDALANLEVVLHESRGTVTRDSLPRVRGDTAQLTSLFQNLIGNALKHRHADRPPRIHIGVQRTGDFWRFSVSDNGQGVPEADRQRIFLAFERSHKGGEGTGIGLAVCQRIVERHGGTISVESTEGEGSAFHFTLPDADTPLPEET